VVKIHELRLAPVKSLRAEDESVDQLAIDGRGLFGDREYMIVEAEEHINTVYVRGHVAPPGHFLSQREDPILTSIVPRLSHSGLVLAAAGHGELWVRRAEDAAANRIPVSVWRWQGKAVDQGEEAASWVSAIVGRPVRLVAVSDEYPRFVEDDPALGRVSFADGYPVTVASVEAFATLNQQLEAQGDHAIPTNRTRTTIILSSLEGPALPKGAFPEDYVSTIRVANNGLVAVLRRMKACGRCPVPDTDQITGARTGRPVLAALARLGRHGYHVDRARYGAGAEVFFSQNFVIELTGGMPSDAQIVLERNAIIDVTYDSQTNWEPKAR
jgi:uncharacterized protein YcbX